MQQNCFHPNRRRIRPKRPLHISQRRLPLRFDAEGGRYSSDNSSSSITRYHTVFDSDKRRDGSARSIHAHLPDGLGRQLKGRATAHCDLWGCVFGHPPVGLFEASGTACFTASTISIIRRQSLGLRLPGTVAPPFLWSESVIRGALPFCATMATDDNEAALPWTDR